MKEESKNKINWRIIAITVVIALITAGVAGWGVWYYMDQRAKQVSDDNIKQVASLQKQIAKIEKASTATPTPTPSLTTAVVETANWKNFSHIGTENTPNFNFRYPVDELATDYTIAYPSVWLSSDGVRANSTLNLVFEPTKSISPKNFFEARVKNPGVPSPYTVIGSLQVGNLDCYQVNFNHMGGAVTSLYFYSNGYAYTASFPTNNQAKYEQVIKSMTF